MKHKNKKNQGTSPTATQALLNLLHSTPSAVHYAASARTSAGIMEPQGRERRRAVRRKDRQLEREARWGMPEN